MDVKFLYLSCCLEGRQLCIGENNILPAKDVVRTICNASFQDKDIDYEYAKPPEDGKFLFKLTKKDNNRSRLVFVDTRTTPNYIWVERCIGDDATIRQVADLLERTFSQAAYQYGWNVKIRRFIPGAPKDVDLFSSALDYVNDYLYEKLCGIKINREAFRAIVIADIIANEAMKLLLIYMKGKKKPKAKVGPLRAAKEAGVIFKITKTTFRDIFGDILGNSLSSVDKYMSDDYVWNPRDEVFKEMKKEFSILAQKIKTGG